MIDKTARRRNFPIEANDVSTWINCPGAAAAVNLKPEFTVQKPWQLFEGPYANVGGVSYAVTPDAQRFLVLEPAEREAAPVTHLNVVLNWLDYVRQRATATPAQPAR